MKILFLDIDGVLNSAIYFEKNHENVIKFNLMNKDKLNDRKIILRRKLMDIDVDKLKLLKDVVSATDVKIVIISSWKRLNIFPYIVNELILYGIPIIGITTDEMFNRGYGIRNYINGHPIDDYAILDDDIFDDYDDELLSKLVKTNFYDDGLTEVHVKKLIKMLKSN